MRYPIALHGRVGWKICRKPPLIGFQQDDELSRFASQFVTGSVQFWCDL
jgi:hypothetical protein